MGGLAAGDLVVVALPPEAPRIVILADKDISGASLADLMDEAEDDVLATWRGIRTRAPNRTAPTRWSASTRRSSGAPTSSASSPTMTLSSASVGALMLKRNDEWAVTRRYMTLGSVGEICKPDDIDPLPPAAE